MDGEIGGVGAAGECAATYGSLGVCEKAGGTAKVCLTAHADLSQFSMVCLRPLLWPAATDEA